VKGQGGQVELHTGSWLTEHGTLVRLPHAEWKKLAASPITKSHV